LITGNIIKLVKQNGRKNYDTVIYIVEAYFQSLIFSPILTLIAEPLAKNTDTGLTAK
jgi:hypothetical protein